MKVTFLKIEWGSGGRRKVSDGLETLMERDQEKHQEKNNGEFRYPLSIGEFVPWVSIRDPKDTQKKYQNFNKRLIRTGVFFTFLFFS